jgi:hypothetical protein
MPTFEHTFASPEGGTTHKGDPAPAYGVSTTTVAPARYLRRMTTARPWLPALAAPLLLLTACQHAATPHPVATTPKALPSSASPSPSCPTGAEIVSAANAYAKVSGYQLAGLLACESGYATAAVHYPGSDTATIVLHLVAGAWQPLILGTDVCGGEGDDGLKRPQWMVGAPTPVITAAHCNLTDYHD